MPFPDLTLVPDVLKGGGSVLLLAAEATGVPDNGNNTFGLPFVAAGVDPALVDPSRMVIEVEPDPGRPAGGSLLPGVEDARFVSLSPDKTQLTLAFSQTAVGNARVTVTVNHTLPAAGSNGDPIIQISSQVGGGGGSADTSLVRNFVVGVNVGDVVFEDATANQVDRADASAAATGLPLGVVRTLNDPGPGQCRVAVLEDLGGFVGLTVGAQYILSTSPGGIVRVGDTGNANYPAFNTPGSGEVLAPIGIASTATSLSVRPGPILQVG